MEFPCIDGDPEDRARLVVGLHHGVETIAVHAAGDITLGRVGCWRIPAGRAEHHHGW